MLNTNTKTRIETANVIVWSNTSTASSIREFEAVNFDEAPYDTSSGNHNEAFSRVKPLSSQEVDACKEITGRLDDELSSSQIEYEADRYYMLLRY